MKTEPLSFIPYPPYVSRKVMSCVILQHAVEIA